MESINEPAGDVLIIDDEPELARAWSRLLSERGFRVTTAASRAEALSTLEDRRVDVVLGDLHSPSADYDLVHEVAARRPSVPVILVTDETTPERGVDALRHGAFDCVVRPLESPESLSAAVHRALGHGRLVERNEYLEREVALHQKFEGMVCASKPMEDVLSLIEAVAPTDVTVLVLGESGTGKELIARAIHKRSHRKNRPFVAINCAALTESVLESELFGHVRGAFTGAVTSRRGLFEEASGGTLLLDEVAELAPATQVRLLRVLQESEIRPVGANEPRKVDVRVIGATHRDIAKMVQAGTFRQDLFYRLNVVSVRVPPLRERPEDIPALVEHFLQKHATRLLKKVSAVTPSAMELLALHPWPGNVRELENVIQRAIVMSTHQVVDDDALPSDVVEGAVAASLPPPGLEPTAELRAPHFTLAAAKLTLERRYLAHVLDLAGGNASEAARLSGVDRSNFRKLLRRHGLGSASARGEGE